jgi:GTP-binding protein
MSKVALVGRPNVGKSALFNRLTGTHRALVENEPGVTRDRLYETTDWNGRTFTVIDTGGLWQAAGDEILGYVRRQTEEAVREADVLGFVVDASEPLSAADWAVADLLRKTRKPVLLVANKAERGVDLSELYALGFGDPLEVSATHGIGVGELLDAIVDRLPDDSSEAEATDGIRIAVAGRPNVGKSSLVNRLVGEERSLVTPIAGTTRDVVDTRIVGPDGTTYVILDTAGLRRPNRVEEGLEERTVARSLGAIRAADVVLLVVSSEEPASHQDLRIAGQVAKQGRAVVMLLNKADLVRGTTRPLVDIIRERFDFLPYARVLPVSAETGWRLNEIWPAVQEAYRSFTTRVSTHVLNQLVRETVALTPPPTQGGRQLRILYATQVGVRPPHIVFFVNDPELAHFSYVRHLEHRLRERFGFQGSPLKLSFRARRRTWR